MKLFYRVLVVVVLLMVTSMPAFAQGPSNEELQKEIAQLRVMVEELKAKVAKLEGHAEKGETPAPAKDARAAAGRTLTLTVSEVRQDKKNDLTSDTEYQALVDKKQELDGKWEAAKSQVDRMKMDNNNANDYAVKHKVPYVPPHSDTEIGRAIKALNVVVTDREPVATKIKQKEKEANQSVTVLSCTSDDGPFEVICRTPSAVAACKNLLKGDRITVTGTVREVKAGQTLFDATTIAPVK